MVHVPACKALSQCGMEPEVREDDSQAQSVWAAFVLLPGTPVTQGWVCPEPRPSSPKAQIKNFTYL